LIHRTSSLALLALTLAACNGDGGGTTPTPAASATPTPAPVSSPSPAASSCALPPSTNPQNNCSVRTPRFSDQVNDAIDQVMAQRPELFDFNDTSAGVPRVKNPAGYYGEVKKVLEAQGICTRIDEEEIAIKSTNDFSEDWKILTSLSFVRRRYAGTCTPAWW
jgi:hypothetical protein